MAIPIKLLTRSSTNIWIGDRSHVPPEHKFLIIHCQIIIIFLHQKPLQLLNRPPSSLRPKEETLGWKPWYFIKLLSPRHSSSGIRSLTLPQEEPPGCRRRYSPNLFTPDIHLQDPEAWSIHRNRNTGTQNQRLSSLILLPGTLYLASKCRPDTGA